MPEGSSLMNGVIWSRIDSTVLILVQSYTWKRFCCMSRARIHVYTLHVRLYPRLHVGRLPLFVASLGMLKDKSRNIRLRSRIVDLSHVQKEAVGEYRDEEPLKSVKGKAPERELLDSGIMSVQVGTDALIIP